MFLSHSLSVLASLLQCHCLTLQVFLSHFEVSLPHTSSVTVSLFKCSCLTLKCPCLTHPVSVSVFKCPSLSSKVSLFHSSVSLSHSSSFSTHSSIAAVSFFRWSITLQVSLSHSSSLLVTLLKCSPVSFSHFSSVTVSTNLQMSLSRSSNVTTSLLQCVVSLLQCDYLTLKMSCLVPPMSLPHS